MGILTAPLEAFEDIDLVKRAYAFAESCHAGATEPGGGPYFNHPLRVARILAVETNIYDAETVASTLLHDVLAAPFQVRYRHLITTFGLPVAAMVRALTPDPAPPGGDLDMAERIYLRHLGGAPAQVLRIKVAEALDHLRHMDRLDEEARRRLILTSQRTYTAWAREHLNVVYHEIRLLARLEDTDRTTG